MSLGINRLLDGTWIRLATPAPRQNSLQTWILVCAGGLLWGVGVGVFLALVHELVCVILRGLGA